MTPPPRTVMRYIIAPHFSLCRPSILKNTRNTRMMLPLGSFSGGKIGGQVPPTLSLRLIRADIDPPHPLQPDPPLRGTRHSWEKRREQCGRGLLNELSKSVSFNNGSHRLGCCALFNTLRVGLRMAIAPV